MKALGFFLALGVAIGALSNVSRAQPSYSWTGFYVGGQLGYGFGRSTQPALGFSDPAGAGIGTFYEAGGISIGPYPSQGVLGGLQAGYNLSVSKVGAWLRSRLGRDGH